MNRLPAVVRELRSSEGVSQLRFDLHGTELVMVGLEPPRGVESGREVELGINATHLILSRSRPEGIALCNVLPVRCRALRRGAILSSVTLEYGEIPLEAIVPTEALETLAPEPGRQLFALFQASELSIIKLIGGEGA